MGILQQRDLIFTHLHLTGALWDQPPRDSFEDRVAAVGKHGCPGMGMGADELDRLITNYSADTIRGVLAEHNVTITEVEVLIGWDAPEEFSGPARNRIFRLAEAVGAPKVKATAVAPPGVEIAPLDELATKFGALCDLAADRGLSVALESIAVIPGFNYGMAADVVIAADRPNGRLQIDTWHLFRDPTGLSAIDKIAGHQVAGIELGDGMAQPSADLMDECVNGRLLPGDGEFDIIPVLYALDAKGVDVPLTVEVLSAKLRRLTPVENVAKTLAAVRAFLDVARTARQPYN
jgi:sugar phosphate isomerase/epimerase